MACDYCLKTEGLEDTWIFCPMCGQHLDAVKTLRWLYKMGERFFSRQVKPSPEFNPNAVYDEDGNPMEMDSTLHMGIKFDPPAFDTVKFEPEKVDISRELNWLKLHSDAEKIVNEK